MEDDRTELFCDQWFLINSIFVNNLLITSICSNAIDKIRLFAISCG